MNKNILILQHISVEDPGFIKDLMIKDKFNLKTVKLYEGEKIPENLKKYDAMFSMGGPMDTWMESKYPWLKDEKKAIYEYVVKLNKPFLGFCLGCQLLGEVLGGTVEKMKKTEIGILDLSMQSGYKNDILFNNFNSTIKVLQWHSYQVNNLRNISNNSERVTDKLPINFKWIGFIKLILPNSKIIHCIRNPRDVCISIYKNYFTDFFDSPIPTNFVIF